MVHKYRGKYTVGYYTQKGWIGGEASSHLGSFLDGEEEDTVEIDREQKGEGMETRRRRRPSPVGEEKTRREIIVMAGVCTLYVPPLPLRILAQEWTLPFGVGDKIERYPILGRRWQNLSMIRRHLKKTKNH